MHSSAEVFFYPQILPARLIPGPRLIHRGCSGNSFASQGAQMNETMGESAASFPVGSLSLCTGFWHEIFLFLPQTFTEFLSNRGERHENKGNKFVRKHLELIEPRHSQRHWEWMLWGNRFYFLDLAESIKEDQHPIYSFFIKPPRSPDGIWDAIWELSAQVLHLRSLQAGLCPHIKLQDSDWGQPGDAWEFGAAQSSSLGSSKTPKFYICH